MPGEAAAAGRMSAADDLLRSLVGLTDIYPCPCRAVGRLTEEQPGVFVITYRHDDSCPVFARRRGAA